MIREHDCVILVGDLPEHNLRGGGLGVVVHAYPGCKCYEVEFVALDGGTLALVTLLSSQVRKAES